MPVVDGHNDLAFQLRLRSGYSVAGLDTGRPDLHTDIPRLRAGGVGAQFWSVFVPSHLPEPEAVVATLEQVDAVHRMVARHPDVFALAYTADDVTRAVAGGRIASLLGIEGGHSLAASTGVLRAFARLGVRYVTLTHNDNTAWADSATDEPAVGGLSDVGRAVVAELQRVGVLVDLSHVAATTMHAALDVARAPVLFSHSSCRALCGHPRNVPDDVLTRMASGGGVVQVTFVPACVSAEVAAWEDAEAAERARFGLADGGDWEWTRSPAPGEDPASVVAEVAARRVAAEARTAASDGYRAWLAANPKPVATTAQVADHVDHAREVAGVDHVGLGGDFDGTDDLPVGLDRIFTSHAKLRRAHPGAHHMVRPD
jgi:membrane dipeptidase